MDCEVVWWLGSCFVRWTATRLSIGKRRNGQDRAFEDLQCWQKGRKLANQIYDPTDRTSFAKDFKLRDQIIGAAGSVMHNIAEGFDSSTNPEFIHFLKMARRSASEV